MATADVQLPTEPTTLYYYLELKDGGIIQTYPGTAFEKRRKHVPHDVTVKDMRSIREKFTVDKNGFQLVNHTTKNKDFNDDEEIKDVYYQECCDLIKRVTGADQVQVVSHMCRHATHIASVEAADGKEDDEVVTVMNPARFVHVDQSYRGAEQILYLNLPEEEADRRIKRRWGIFNVWQPYGKKVERDPLTFCDYRTVDENDFRTVVANLPPPGSGHYGNVSQNNKHAQKHEYSSNGEKGPIYEVTNMAYNPNQDWYYASDMTPEEAWVFKIFDSKEDGRARCAVHTSFPLPGQEEHGDPRTSVEVRLFAFWDDEDPQ